MNQTTVIHDDPFTTLNAFLWRIFEANPFLQEYVKAGNRIKFENTLGFKDQVVHGDLPEIILVPNGNNQETMGDSATRDLTQNYRFYVSTDDKRPWLMNRIKWELFRCLEVFNMNAVKCHFNGKPFILLVQTSSSAEGLTEGLSNRGITGWCSTWDFSVRMQFPKEDMIFDIGEQIT